MKMKVCFVGIGSIARRHIRNLCDICSADGMDIKIDALRRQTSYDKDVPLGIDKVYTSCEEMPTDYDVVFLTNPTEFHADMLVRLHDHAKHFFVEKPVTSLRTVDKMRSVPFRKDSIYYVACPLRYCNVISYLKNEVELKKVYAVRSISSSYLPDWRAGIDYRETYSAHRELGGGVSIDLIHEWDYLTYLFGMPTNVSCYMGKVSDLEIDSDDYAIYIAQYKNMIAELHLDYFGRKSIRNIELYTDEDTIIGDLINSQVRFLKEGKLIDLTEDRDAYQKRELAYFVDLITKGGESQNDIANALQVLELTQGILQGR